MNYTREPIIETIITPKEGCKLLICNSKREKKEDYYLVDAIEVVSFGQSMFYRSLERPKSFLVPVQDYEVVEVKETRLALKNVGVEKSIKIGGGKPMPRPSLEEGEGEMEPEAEVKRSDKKRERRRQRRRKQSDAKAEREDTLPIEAGEPIPEGGVPLKGEPAVTPSMISGLIPPPPTLIAHSISRYKEELASQERPSRSEPTEEEKHMEGESHSKNRRSKIEAPPIRPRRYMERPEKGQEPDHFEGPLGYPNEESPDPQSPEEPFE